MAMYGAFVSFVDFLRFPFSAALAALAREGRMEPETVRKAIEEMEIDPNKVNPVTV